MEEFNLFIDTVMDKYEAWMGFQIMFWTGMRVGELLALKVEDIDFEDKTIRIDLDLIVARSYSPGCFWLWIKLMWIVYNHSLLM